MLVTGDRGSIVELNHFGKEVPPFDVEHRFIQFLYPAAYQDGDTQYCAIAVDSEGKQLALGLTTGTKEKPLPKPVEGAMSNQIKSVTSGKLLDGRGGQWLFAGPDGSVHVVNHDGDPARYDYWRVGEQLTGIAVAQIDDQPVVVLATEDELVAWRVKGSTAPQP